MRGREWRSPFPHGSEVFAGTGVERFPPTNDARKRGAWVFSSRSGGRERWVYDERAGPLCEALKRRVPIF